MFNETLYHDFCYKRIKLIIDYYGFNFFHNKTVLDLGEVMGMSVPPSID